MIPIQELLNRVRWDAAYGDAHFVLGYYDRVADAVLRVDMEEVAFPLGDHFFIEITDADGERHSVPLHRIRELWRNGDCVWRREG